MPGPEIDPQLESIDLLTEMWRQHADTWAARVQAAEARAGAVATTAAALGTLIVSQAERLNTAHNRATVAFVCLMVAVVLSLFARSLPRANALAIVGALLWPPRPGEASTRRKRAMALAPTASQRDARDKLDDLRTRGDEWTQEGAKVSALLVRKSLHDYWRARASSNHGAYNQKSKWVSAAAITLVIALLLMAWAGWSILDDADAKDQRQGVVQAEHR